MVVIWLTVIYLWCISFVKTQDLTQTADGWSCGPVNCPNNTLLCFITNKSTDNDTKLTKIGTCMSREGDVTKEETRIADNPAKNKTDVVSMNVINLNSPYINELRSTLVGVLKSFLARSAYPQYSPYVQVTPPPQGYQQGYQQPPQSQIIIVQPPAPQVVFSDGRVETGPKDGYGKTCPVIDCSDRNPNPNPPIGPQPPRLMNYQDFNNINNNNNQKFELPNIQPPLLAKMYRTLDDIEMLVRNMREQLKDASAAATPPYLNKNQGQFQTNPFPQFIPPAGY